MTARILGGCLSGILDSMRAGQIHHLFLLLLHVTLQQGSPLHRGNGGESSDLRVEDGRFVVVMHPAEGACIDNTGNPPFASSLHSSHCIQVARCPVHTHVCCSLNGGVMGGNSCSNEFSEAACIQSNPVVGFM